MKCPAKLVIVLFIILSFGLMQHSVYAADVSYHVIKRLQLGEEGGWDYLTVDSAARRLYVSRSTHVMVVDIDTDKVIADIPDTPGVHGIAVAPEINRGFTSNGRNNTATVMIKDSFEILVVGE